MALCGQAGEVCLVVHPDNQGWTFVTAASGQQVATASSPQPRTRLASASRPHVLILYDSAGPFSVVVSLPAVLSAPDPWRRRRRSAGDAPAGGTCADPLPCHAHLPHPISAGPAVWRGSSSARCRRVVARRAARRAARPWCIGPSWWWGAARTAERGVTGARRWRKAGGSSSS